MPKRHADTDDLQANIQNLTQEISGPNEFDGEVAIATVMREVEEVENAEAIADSKSAQVALESESTRRQGQPQPSDATTTWYQEWDCLGDTFFTGVT